MMIILEGCVMSFLLLITCVVGIANGAVGLVVLYEEDVQERVIQLGLTTKERIKRSLIISSIAMFVPALVLAPGMVYFLNGARTFWEVFSQTTLVLWIMGVFDRLFTDWYWVGKTKAWDIPGTEDLKPYIPKKVLLGKWVGTIIGFPLMAALSAGVIMLFV